VGDDRRATYLAPRPMFVLVVGPGPRKRMTIRIKTRQAGRVGGTRTTAKRPQNGHETGKETPAFRLFSIPSGGLYSNVVFDGHLPAPSNAPPAGN
jgi:hypothetical protein